MDQTLNQRLEELSQKIIDVTDQVTAVAEAEIQRPPEIRQANSAVDKLVDDYTSLLRSVSEEERLHVERNVGRRVTDLRRMAARLPQLRHSTKSIPTISDDSFGGFPSAVESPESFAAEHAAPPDALPSPLPRPEPAAATRVAGDIEAWCGPCGGLRDHTIVAMVQNDPKQVICQSCGARHGYRVTPARSQPDTAKRSGAIPQSGAAKANSLKKEQERMALQKELVEAVEVRSFERRARYKRGEIIEHAEFGRGKIENVLKGSLLVRFRSGLKALSTY